MKKIKYFLFSLICMFCCSVVFAKDEISVEKMIPVYDENSGVIVTEENGVHSVIFNDKDQSVKYNIVLKNNTNIDIPIDNLKFPKPTEDFLKYELTGIGEGAVLEANSTKDIVLSLETIKTEGWGRNFNLDFTGKVEIDNTTIINPNTAVKEVMFVLAFVTCTTGILIITVKNRKVARYVALIVMFGSAIGITNAKETLLLPIKLNVSFESQNVMSKSGAVEEVCDSWEENGKIYEECWEEYIPILFWEYNLGIKNIYIENEFDEKKEYAHKFDVSEKKDGKVIAYLVEKKDDVCYDWDDNEINCYNLYLQADGVIYPNKNAHYYFAGMVNLDSIENFEGFDTSKVTDMSHMFNSTGVINPNFALDLSNFDTSNVTNMQGMFAFTGANNPNFTLDVSNFDTSNVTNMRSMFSSTGEGSEVFTLDVSNFDTSNVTNMSYMFNCIGANNPNFTLDVSNFDTSKVTDMTQMFYYTGRSSNIFALDLSNFDTSNVTNMSYMFSGTGHSSPNFTLDVSNFDTSNVTNMKGMFNGTGYYSEVLTLDVSNFDTSKVTNMSGMFYETGFNSTNFTLDLSSFNTSNVTDMRGMFCSTGYSNQNFTLDVSNFDTSKVTDMSGMFDGTGYNSSVFTLDLSNFDTSNVTDMASMFLKTGYNSTKLNISFTIRNPNTTSYYRMFNNVATKSGSKITVNYTKDTEDLVDRMIATKSSNSNVVKGVQVD